MGHLREHTESRRPRDRAPSRHEVTNVFDSGPARCGRRFLMQMRGREWIRSCSTSPGPDRTRFATHSPAAAHRSGDDRRLFPTRQQDKHEEQLRNHPMLYSRSFLMEPHWTDRAYVDGLCVRGGNSTVRGLVINSFPGERPSVRKTGGNVIEGNFIGTNEWGMTGR